MTPSGWTLAPHLHKGYWWNHRGILMLNLCLILPLLSATINGLDSSLNNGLQILPAWQNFFDAPEGRALGLINSAQNIGGIVSLPFSPFISDTFGRRMTLLVGATIMLCGVLLQGLATSPNTFIGARIIIGFGLTFSSNAAPLLIAELAYPTQRGKLTSMFNTLWYSGSILSSWACYAAFNIAGSSQWTWRIPTLGQAIGPILQICLIWFIPESPRFLVSKGMESQASKVIARYHSNGSEQDPLVVFEMAQIRHALKQEKDIRKNYSFWQFWTTRGNLKRLRIIVAVALFTQLSGNGLVSYYISLVLDGIGFKGTNTKTAINGSLQIWNLIFAMTGTFLVDKVGRRPLFLISTIGMLCAFSTWTLTTALFSALNNTTAAKATVPIIFIYYAFYDICYSPLLSACCTYSLEILPYGIRAQGFAAMNMCIELALLFDQFVNPIVIERIGWKYYLVYCIWLAIEVAFVFMYIVETKGRTLEENAALFDGEKPRQELAQKGGQAAAEAAAGVFPLTPRSDEDKEVDYLSTEEWFENTTLQIKNSPPSHTSHTPTSSRRQSQESGLAIMAI
ncbi:general substrate transporter [Athelia psychrophila]|uniref:General substrate transporter n=1 Tax=Athelia psychrophila TaxID=1759441 RepID=A0A166MBG3_9AGAM|nr:general substrate transporter [Fibularhizoctonia sp. CBS 109695]